MCCVCVCVSVCVCVVWCVLHARIHGGVCVFYARIQGGVSFMLAPEVVCPLCIIDLAISRRY